LSSRLHPCSFSGTNAFIALAAEQRSFNAPDLLFAGEEDGGDTRDRRGSGGTQQTLISPLTGERLTLALTGFVPPLGMTLESVRIPDWRNQPTGRDIARETDRVLVTVQHRILAERGASLLVRNAGTR
jgi:hypothetical protein